MIDISEVLLKYSNVAVKLPPSSVPYLKVSKCDDETNFDAKVHLQSSCSQPFAVTDVYEFNVQEHKIVSQGEDIKSVYDLTLTTESSVDHRFHPGDTVGILTRNSDDDVAYVEEHLGLEPIRHDIYRVEIDPATKKKAAKIPPYIPQVVQVRKLLVECLDLKAIPKKLSIRALLDHTTDETEKKFLSLLCSKEGSAFDDIVLDQRMGFVTLLKSIPSCKPPLSVLIEHLPRLMPRPYSIANYSDSLDSNKRLRIIFSINDSAPGLTTNLLKNCCLSGDPVFLYFRKSNCFSYTEDDLDMDIVMIGVGTGLAPYLGFLERRKEVKGDANNCSLGKAWLFVGFRYERSNFLCRDEIEQYKSGKTLDNLSVAFSRDQDSRFRYVQDQLEANNVELVRMLCGSKCKLYVCGNGKTMLPQVEAKIVDMISDIQGIGKAEASSLIAEQKKNHKYVEDVWL